MKFFFLLLLFIPASVMAQQQEALSFDEALQLLATRNQSLKIAGKAIEIAREERGKLSALWFPTVQATGAAVYLSQKIEVKQPLSPFTNPVKDWVHSLLPDEQIITSVLDQIGVQTLVFPLAPKQMGNVDVSAQWILFAGGKRLRAAAIGRTMEELSQENRRQVSAEQQTLLAESYYGLCLAQQVAEVRRSALDALERHYQNALKLETTGIIDRAGKLLAQVNRDEAKREWEAACKNEQVGQSALKALLNRKQAETDFAPSSPLFINDSLPLKAEFIQAMNGRNPLLNQLSLQTRIAKQQVRIGQSGYLPNIALFGKQTLYAKGIQRNLVPRSMIGIGFTWNLFDGLEREHRIRQSKLEEQTLMLGREKARDGLIVAIDQLYAQLEKAQENVKALNATIALSKELVRIRKRSFAEGMATSAEVIDAETLLAKVRVARLAAYYEYDVTLMQMHGIAPL